MDQNNGGILGKINTPTTTVASGVWSLDSQFEAQSSSIWPLAFPQTTIANSCRFNKTDNPELSITYGSNGNRRTMTFSFWIKFSKLDTNMYPMSIYDASSGYQADIRHSSANQLRMYATDTAGTPRLHLLTNRLFRDLSAWYHIHWKVDTTQSTESDRVKLFVNGVQETSFATETYPPQNTDLRWNGTNDSDQGGVTRINNIQSGTGSLDGYMAEVIFIDGTALDATSFGAFNPVTNIWEPRAYAGTYGTNGFRLDFANSSALGNDVSGNDNDFTVSNLASVDQSTDTCSNNFATMNPIAAQAGSSVSSSVITFTEGNLIVDAISSETAIANFGVDTGKWYWEVKVLTDQDGLAIGAANQHFHLDAELGYNSPSSPSDAKVFGYYGGNGNKFTTVGDGSQLSSYGDAIAVNDIIGVALNLDDDEVVFYKNGTAQNSGTAISITALGDGEQYFPAVGNWSGSAVKLSFNFGSPHFSISSGNADANGHGNFEYAVPSGYFALCTKNLAEFG